MVCGLLQGLQGRGHHLYTDAFYSNPYLFCYLYDRGTYACGTVKKTRKGFCKELVLTKPEESRVEMGTIDWRVASPLLAVTWKDKRLVYVISTIHPPKTNGKYSQVTRRRGPQPDVLPCLHAVDDYIKYMRGVDRSDQLISLCNAGRRTKKWWKRLFYHELEIAVLNAHIIFDKLLGKTTPLLKFKMALCNQLVAMLHIGKIWEDQEEGHWNDDSPRSSTCLHLFQVDFAGSKFALLGDKEEGRCIT